MEKQMEKMRPIGLTTLSIDELGERAAAIAQDIQFAMTRAMTDIVSLGEILLEVKQRSEFGRYGNYGRFLAENGLEERMAQYSVAAYKRYAQKPEILTALGSVSKLKELLALPEAMEEEFLAVRDVQGTVSYTHLDVYKRQIHTCRLIPSRVERVMGSWMSCQKKSTQCFRITPFIRIANMQSVF